jgi:hypothetical protein
MTDDFLSRLMPRIDAGRSRFGETMQKLLRLVRPDLYELLISCDEQAFLEPLAFLYFSTEQREVSLEQVFAGYVAAARRALRAPVLSDRNGRFYVPRLGYFNTSLREQELELIVPADSDAFAVEHDGSAIPYTLEPTTTLPDTSVELCRYPMLLLDQCFVGADGQPVAVDIQNAAAAHAQHLAKAMDIIRRVWPSLYEAIVSSVRRLVIFRSDALNSFATTAAHGAAFFNAALGDDELFYLEDLAHQCGHVIFSAATFDAAEHFVVPPTTRMGAFNGQPGDDRSVYVALHGVFTEALMARCLDAWLAGGRYERGQHHELEGRLAFILKRFTADLRPFARAGILSRAGAELMSPLHETWQELAYRHRELVNASNMSNQGYNFSYRKYAELNPPAV